MNAKRAPYLKTLRYCCYLAFAAILVYLVGNLSGFYPDRRVANKAWSSKSDMTIIQEKQPEKPTLESYKEVSDSNRPSIIGDREKATDPQDLPKRIENLPGSFLNFVLVGIVKGDDGRSQAIIEDRETKTQGMYTEGSRIGGARVMRISGTRVILSVDGKAQVLDMNTQQNAPLQEESALPTDESNWWDNRSVLGYAEVELQVRLKPFIHDGTQEGFEVKSIFDYSPLKAIGVEDGDIIKTINGELIDSDLDLLLIDDAINNGDSYTISVVRSGKTIILSEQVK